VIHEVVSIGQGAQVLLRFTNNHPALALQNVGEGRFILANFSPALKAGDLGKYGSFPALTHSLLRYVKPHRDWRYAAVAGESLNAQTTIPVGEKTGSIVVRNPDDALLTPTVSRDAQRLFIDLPRTELTGFYAVFRNHTKVADVAINVDPRESDLTTIDSETLQAQLASNGMQVQVADVDNSKRQSPLRGQPLWHWFVVGAMFMIGLELLLLNVWNK